MIVAVAAIAGVLFGAAVMSAFFAVDARGNCGGCERWRLVAAERMADIDRQHTRIVEIERQNEALILGAADRLEEWEW